MQNGKTESHLKRPSRPASALWIRLTTKSSRSPDGASIIVTHFDGSTVTHPCTYIDDTHAKIGSSVYHLLEFAGLMERNGSIYAPEGGVADYYEVYQADFARGLLFPRVRGGKRPYLHGRLHPRLCRDAWQGHRASKLFSPVITRTRAPSGVG